MARVREMPRRRLDTAEAQNLDAEANRADTLPTMQRAGCGLNYDKLLRRRGVPVPTRRPLTTADVAAWLERQAEKSANPHVKSKADEFGDTTAYQLGVAQAVIKSLLTDRNGFWRTEYRKQIFGGKT